MNTNKTEIQQLCPCLNLKKIKICVQLSWAASTARSVFINKQGFCEIIPIAIVFYFWGKATGSIGGLLLLSLCIYQNWDLLEETAGVNMNWTDWTV